MIMIIGVMNGLNLIFDNGVCKMIINVYSYQDALDSIREGNNKNWISIRDVGYSYLYEQIDKAKNILELYFDDVRDYDIEIGLLHPFYDRKYKKSGLIVFDSEMADRIKLFVDKIFDNGEVLNIHCWAGRSRSQGIFNVLNQYYNLFIEDNKEDFLKNIKNNNEKFMGNSDVIKIMQEVFFKVV